MTGPSREEARVRALLPHTRHAFFGRFARLSPIQRAAIPPIVAGDSVTVCAPTASGKTEAVVAPLLERCLGARASGLCLLIVTPTRALANDLQRRLRNPVRAAGARVELKTGDSPDLKLSDEPTVVITTPESLDSLLCRRAGDLRQVRGILIDEVHLLSTSVRGDQLRCLMGRLDRVAGAPQRCGASATVPDPDQLAKAFLGPAGTAVRAQGASHRPIEARLEPAIELEEAVERIRALWAEQPGRKVLVFANSRSQVEALAARLRKIDELASRVCAHHGSLSRSERLRVERRLQAAPSGICVATMTLEIGIDIGDVDRTVLIAPPPNVSALLQRVGRSNRREEATHVLALYGDGFERRRIEHLLECARAGRLFVDPVGFRPTVLAQQALGLTLQNPKGWVSAKALHDRLPADLAALWTRGDCREILDRMAEEGYLRRIEGDRLVADEAAGPLVERGRVHSMIVDTAEAEVIDRATGRTVGRARFSRADRERLRAGETVRLGLGGRRRDVAHVRDRKVYVDTAGGEGDGRFIGSEPPRYSQGLAADLGRHLGLEPRTLVVSELPNGRYMLAHFLGTVWGRVLARLLLGADLQIKPRRADAFFTTLDRAPAIGDDGLPVAEGLGAGSPGALPAAIRRALEEDRGGLARILGAGPLTDAIPGALMDRWIADSVDPEALAERLGASRFVWEQPDPGEGEDG